MKTPRLLLDKKKKSSNSRMQSSFSTNQMIKKTLSSIVYQITAYLVNRVRGGSNLPEVYITLDEAAELEEVKYNTFVQRLNRNQSKYKIKTEKRDGGKDRVLVGLSSLSKKARRTFKEKENITANELVVSKLSEDAPWYVTTDLNWFIENYKKNYYAAVETANKISEFLSYDDGDRTLFAQEFAEELGISQRTLYRQAQSYIEAGVWALKLEKKNGHNYDFFKVLSLCRKPREKDSFPSLTDDMKIFIEGIWFNKAFASNIGTIEMLYSKVEDFANSANVEYPSYSTVARYINYLMDQKGLSNTHYLAAKGTREWKNHMMVKGSRDVKSLDVLELLQGDEHTFDCWVAYKHPNGKVTAVKPKLVAWIDTRSKAILGDVVCLHPNSQILKLSLLKAVYGSPIGGVPKYLLIDNGRDYKSETMTGIKKSERKEKQKLKIENPDLYFDEETKGFYRSIGIEDVMHSKPYQPWSKAQMERFFGGVCSRFTKWFSSYTGTLTGSQTSGKVKKDIDGMLERGELLTMEKFYDLWSLWLSTKYHQKPHSTLKKEKERYQTPQEMFEKCEDKYFKAAPPKSFATILMMKSERVPVTQLGIKRFGYEYRHDDLCKWIHKKVDIKYDPEDLTKLYVFAPTGEKICEAVSQELLAFGPAVSQQALIEHNKMQKRQLSNANGFIGDTQAALAELIEQYSQFGTGVVGFEGLTLQAKPNQNVVSLPQDRNYKSEIKDKSAKKKVEDNEYFNKKAQEALTKLRALG